MTAKDSEDWFTADFTQYFSSAGFLSSLDYGVRYADHEREAQSPEGASPGNIWSDLQNGATSPYPSDFAGSIGGNFPRDLWYFTPNALKDAILGNSTWLSDNDGPTGRHNYGGEWKVSEKNLAAYVQANFTADNWSGNFGLRYVDIDQDINSYQAVANPANADVSSLFGNWIYRNTSNSHSRVLPSANLRFNLDDDLLFRFAASQTQTLPDYSALGASSWGSDLNKTGGGGNPNLKPVLSTNFDANLEWYFMPRGLGVGRCVRDGHAGLPRLRHRNADAVQRADPPARGLPGLRADQRRCQGAWPEVNYEQPIGEFFGFNANYTYSDGSTSHTWADGSNNLVGNSKNTYNVGGYFENDTFGARIGYTYRSSFLIGLSGANPYYQDDFGTLSLALSYKVNDHLSFTFDALNLNDPTIKYYQSATIPTSFYSNGRQYYLNARLKF